MLIERLAAEGDQSLSSRVPIRVLFPTLPLYPRGTLSRPCRDPVETLCIGFNMTVLNRVSDYCQALYAIAYKLRIRLQLALRVPFDQRFHSSDSKELGDRNTQFRIDRSSKVVQDGEPFSNRRVYRVLMIGLTR